jgi:SNF2 family DNA or RNA helicase
MMLANIVNGQPRKGQHPRTTLLVASPALLTQWNNEIEQHTSCGFKIMRYGSGTRIDSNHTFDILKAHDIILTTYGEVMKSYPKNEPPIECQTAEQKIAWWQEVFDKQRGVLHRMRFLRIVLDEAQTIKNHLGRTSIACRALIAHHKWALSGTPILNSLTELYPYFKFLGVPHTGSFKIFKHNYCDTNDAENTERLLVRLSQFMIRRTHADRMFNAPILKLPQADQATFYCDFNPVERCIYEIVRQRFAKNINMWQQKGDLERSYSNALVMLLRLRQLTAHVLMLQSVMRDLLEIEDIEKIKEVVAEEAADSNTRSGSTIIAIRKQLEKHAIEEKKKAAARADAAAKAKAAGKKPEEYLAEDNEDDAQEQAEPEEPEEESSQTTAQAGASKGGAGRQFGKEYNFKPFLESLKTGESWEKAKKKARCSWCNKPPKNPMIASCGHLICNQPCWEDCGIAAAEVEKEHIPCKACGVTPTTWQPFEADGEDSFVDGVATGTRSKAAQKAAGQKKAKDAEDISSDWLSLAGTEVLPSAKTMAIKAQILNWKKEDPKVKIIIYTQFLAM